MDKNRRDESRAPIVKPKPVADEAYLSGVGRMLSRVKTRPLENPETNDNIVRHYLPHPTMTEMMLSKIRMVLNHIRHINEPRLVEVYAHILAIVPTYESDVDVCDAIEGLLLQTRPIDRILVVVNGPGEVDLAYRKALPYAVFPNVTVVAPRDLKGKVNALNWAYNHYARNGGFEYILGVDADVVCDSNMVHYLESDLIDNPRAGGMMARYWIDRSAPGAKRRTKSLIANQRFEFAMASVKQQLRHYESDILGGQATLFRCDALAAVAEQAYKGNPWDIRSKVEDAELTRALNHLGYTAKVSKHGNARVGAMLTTYAWSKQRRKWQDGHLEDLTREFHPVEDRRRWFSQVSMAWNVLIRITFITLLVASVFLHQFVFSPLWFIPVILAILQATFVACKMHDRSLRDVINAIIFVPGEIYFLRILSVWLESVIVMLVNMRSDGWKLQYKAEGSKKHVAISGWVVMMLATLIPIVVLSLVLPYFLSTAVMSLILKVSWTILVAMTILSCLSMAWFIVRFLRHSRTIVL